MQTFHVYLETDNPTYSPAFRSIVQTLTERVKTDPVQITYKDVVHPRFTLFQFQSWSAAEYDADTIDFARAFVSLVLTEWIFQIKEPEIIEEMAATLLEAEEAEEEWPEILPYVLRMCEETGDQEASLIHMATRKAKVYRKLFDYLEEERQINLLGFVRFRLHEHWNDLFERVEAGLDEYLEDKQYQEFVDLLRYFISVQETKYPLVHVVPDLGKQFLLYDERGEEIQLDQLDAILSVGEQSCREEDYLVSALVTLAPKQIVLHHAEEKQALAQTINNIFDNRLRLCTSCTFCLISRRTLDVTKPTQL
ncbi:sporulation protein YtxC [Brevibacillus sp. H7]|uniref:sporulation protein YtxC n=1 Tax=Brevibacillus sp. H7 TaxID=3349138 RepID=UPI0038196A2E